MITLWRRFQELNPPVRWLTYFILVVMGLSFLFAPMPKPVNWNEISFHTQSSAEMYFHNVRSYYYSVNEREKAPFIIYRLKRGNSGLLSFMIIENRRADEAYIYGEWDNEITKLEAPVVYFTNDSLPESGFEHFTNQDHFRLAARCYGALINHEQIHLLNRNDTVSQLFKDENHQRNAMILLEDYFKLVRKE